MRKHSVRKWLHAILDLLPVMILPIFAIYEINHKENEPITIETYKNAVLDFNQKVDCTFNNFTYNSGISNLSISGNNINTSSVNNTRYWNITYNAYQTISQHIYIVRTNVVSFSDVFCLQLNSDNYNRTFTAIGTFSYRITGNGYYFNYRTMNQNVNNTEFQFNIFDLTQMYGSGNEPTTSDFNDLWLNDYYPYTVSHRELIKNYETVVYDNTDVGSQMLYSLYKPINDYFNFDNVFTFGSIYDWFELNMFGGNAPMPIFIVWNIIVYEFLMDMIFLLYSVLMFVIDFATDVIDRFLTWSKKGGN